MNPHVAVSVTHHQLYCPSKKPLRRFAESRELGFYVGTTNSDVVVVVVVASSFPVTVKVLVSSPSCDHYCHCFLGHQPYPSTD